MRLVILLLCSVASTPALAQFSVAPGVLGNVGGAPAVNGFEGSTSAINSPFPDRSNAAVEAIRIKDAVALRREAYALQAADGGVLTAKHKLYINRRAREIMGW